MGKEENIMGTMPVGRLLFKLAMPMIFSVLVSSLYKERLINNLLNFFSEVPYTQAFQKRSLQI